MMTKIGTAFRLVSSTTILVQGVHGFFCTTTTSTTTVHATIAERFFAAPVRAG